MNRSITSADSSPSIRSSSVQAVSTANAIHSPVVVLPTVSKPNRSLHTWRRSLLQHLSNSSDQLGQELASQLRVRLIESSSCDAIEADSSTSSSSSSNNRGPAPHHLPYSAHLHQLLQLTVSLLGKVLHSTAADPMESSKGGASLLAQLAGTLSHESVDSTNATITSGSNESNFGSSLNGSLLETLLNTLTAVLNHSPSSSSSSAASASSSPPSSVSSGAVHHSSACLSSLPTGCCSHESAPFASAAFSGSDTKSAQCASGCKSNTLLRQLLTVQQLVIIRS
jgi:hypothetical protein